MSDPDLLPSQVEHDLRSAVRDLLADRCPAPAVAALYDGDRSLVDRLWRALTQELGLGGMLVPESGGGAGATERETSVVLEELGRAVAPVPFLTSAVVAATLVSRAGDVPAGLATGDLIAALAVPWSTAPSGTAPPGLSVDGSRLSGSVRAVAGAVEADLLLVPVRAGGDVDVYAVRRAATTVTPVSSLDMTRQLADLSLDGAPGDLLLEQAGEAVDRALLTGAALLCAEQVGLAQWCLETTLEHLRTRHQFGRPLGGFQALKHRVADLYTVIESASVAARYAAVSLAAGEDDAAVAVSLAQAYCSDVAVRAAEEALQLHGGIGMTWEHPLHLYLKRAKADQVGLGTPGEHRARLGRLVDLLPPAPEPAQEVGHA